MSSLNKGQFKTIDQVWKAIDAGQTIYWANESYRVLIEQDNVPQKRLSSNRGNLMLRVTCLSNWFGSRLEASELGQLFTK